MASEYELGDTVELRAEFRVATVLTNPSAVTFSVKSPSGVTSAPAASAVSTGIHRTTVVANEHGVWYYRSEGTGPAAGVAESAFRVKHSRFG